MRLICHLRELRGKRTLAELARLAGVNDGELSKIERGVALPRDEQLAGLEQAYGAPRTAFYSEATLLAIQEDELAYLERSQDA